VNELQSERQWVITQARKKIISESDMEAQLAALSAQEVDLKRQIAEITASSQFVKVEDLESRVRVYLEDVRFGISALDAEPTTEEERVEQYRLKRQAVKTLVERVNIDKDRNLEVVIKLDVQEILKNASGAAVAAMHTAFARAQIHCHAFRAAGSPTSRGLSQCA
jgi:hypothetical protein